MVYRSIYLSVICSSPGAICRKVVGVENLDAGYLILDKNTVICLRRHLWSLHLAALGCHLLFEIRGDFKFHNQNTRLQRKPLPF